jgi:hypothetical protein
MPGDSGCNRGDYARVLCFISHARLRVRRAPGIPHALYRAEVHAQLGRIRAAGMWMRVHALFVVPAWSAIAHAAQGPITTGFRGYVLKPRAHGAWVPARASLGRDDQTSSSAAFFTAISPCSRDGPSKCEFGFSRKGLSQGAEFQLAVLHQPVYNPALRYLR